MTANTPTAPAIDVSALRKALRATGMDHEFQTVTSTYIGRFSNDVWRLDLDNGVRLIAKSAFQATDTAHFERLFYRDVVQPKQASRQQLPVPRFVCEQASLLIIEYVELDEFNFQHGVSPAHATAAVDALADWHAAFWQAPPVAAWIPRMTDREIRKSIQQHYDAAWRVSRNRLLAYVPEFAELGDAMLGNLAASLEPMGTPATLIHGDAHAENIALKKGAVPAAQTSVAILDWEDVQVANPGLDLAVFTTMSYRHSARGAVEHDLVQRHADRVRQHGCAWPDPWHDYRLGLLRRVARIVEIADRGFSSVPWVFRRSALAALENDVTTLIRQN